MKHKEVFLAILFMSGIIVGVNVLLKPIPDERAVDGEQTSMVNHTDNEAKTKMGKLSMHFQGINITEIRENTIYAVNTIEIKNPLPEAVNVTGLDYTVNINSVATAKGRYDKGLQLPASGSTTIQLPIRIEANAIDKLNNSWKEASRDSALYSFVNTVHTDIPIAGENKFVVRMEQVLPMIWSPEIVTSDFDVSKLSVKNSGIDMTVQVRNPNPFDIRMREGQLSLSVDGKHNMSGSTEKEVVLPANATVPVPVQIMMNTEDALKMNWRTLFDKKDTPYTIIFSGLLSSEQKLLNKTGFRFRNTGSVSELMHRLEKQQPSK